MAADPNDPRPSHKVRLAITGVMHGLDVTLECEVDARKLDASLRYLVSQGLEPTPRPLVFDLTPDGKPICPRHRAPMSEREKQGDRWYSHRVLDAAGEELWCRGYAGPETPATWSSTSACRSRRGSPRRPSVIRPAPRPCSRSGRRVE